MKKIFIVIFFYSVLCLDIIAQPLPDSLKIMYNAAKTDSEKGECLSTYMDTFNGDSSSWKNILALISYFKENNDQVGEDYVQLFTAFNLSQTGQFNTALNQSLKILSRFEARHDEYGIINAYLRIADALYFSGDIEQCIIYCKRGVSRAPLAGNKKTLSSLYNEMGNAYNGLNMPDSGLIYAQKAVNYDYESKDSINLANSVSTLGESYIAKKEYEKAIPFIKESIMISKAIDYYHSLSWDLNDLAQIFLETKQLDSARYYAHMAVELSTKYGLKEHLMRAYEYLYKSYEKTDTKDSVYKYFKLAVNTKDSLYTAQKAKDIQAINFREQVRKQEIEQDKIQLQNKIRTYGLIAGIVVLLLIAFLLFRNNRSRKKANAALQKQNEVIHLENERKTKELEDARHLQLSMLPKELPKLPHLDIAVYMKTATEVGGDYYDFNVDINGTLTVLVGDATGHGMMSGMMVSIMKSFFISNKSNIELKSLFENANNSIKDMHLGRLMMACMGVQITSEKIIATNAGMPSLIYFRNKSQKAGEFVSHNFPLGAMNENRYSLKEINYESGDVILLMSDGFAELRNENDEQYSYTRIKEEFKSVASKSTNEIVEHLKNSASEWINGAEPDDDATFVVIKIK
jgi:serine phosphatase RsbU (regulator of sigma subunit)